MPNGSILTTNKQCTLHIPTLSTNATSGYILPGLKKHSLISIAKLCDNDCIATFTKKDVTITKNNKSIWKGQRDNTTKLWMLPLPPEHHQVNNVHTMDTVLQQIQYLHACAGYPTKTTWLQAIKNGYFATWPIITYKTVQKYLTEPEPTIKGHINQIKQNTRSTQTLTKKQKEPEATDEAIYTAIHAITDKIYSDQTGRFPVTSSKGNKYVMVLYHYKSNAILVEPIKSRQDSDMIKAYNNLITRITTKHALPTIHYMDNEASINFKANLKTKYQLVPPHTHRRNAAKVAIKTFKQHFIAILAGTHKQFPLHLWCRLLPQAEMTLNMLRPCRYDPTMSAYQAIQGEFNYDTTPLEILGCKAITHEKPHQRKTWAPHAVDGWYIGPAMEHFRCYKVYIPQTQAERITDTLRLIHHNIMIPNIAKQIPMTQLQAIDNLKQMLKENTLTNNNGVQRVKTDPPRKIVACPTPDIVASQPQPTIMSQPEPPHRYPTRYQTNNHFNQVTQSQLEEEVNVVIDEKTGKSLTYRQLIKHPDHAQQWNTSCANELGRLTQGVGNRIKGTNTAFWMTLDSIPPS